MTFMHFDPDVWIRNQKPASEPPAQGTTDKTPEPKKGSYQFTDWAAI